MRRCDPDSLRKLPGHASYRVSAESSDCIGKVSGRIERSHADIDVNHELLIGGPDRSIETLPCFDAQAKLDFIHVGRGKEVAILANSDASVSRMLLQDKVESRYQRRWIVVAELWLTVEVPKVR